MAVGVAGGVAPVHKYTSYEVAVADDGHVRAAVVCVASTAPLAGEVLVTQSGAGIDAVVKVVLLDRSQPVAGPLAFLGTINQLYNVPAVRLVAL